MSNNGVNSPDLWNELLDQKSYLFDSGNIVNERIKFAIKYLMVNQQTLNIGSGQGFLEKALMLQNKDFSEFTSLDISIQGLKRLSMYGGNRVAASAVKLPFKNLSFEKIVCMEVLEHFSIEKVIQVYSEIKRVSRKSATYIFSVPVYEPMSLINHPVGHFRKYTPKEFLNELVFNGFEINKIKYIYAFNNLYFIKSKIAEITSLRRPSVVVVVCRSK